MRWDVINRVGACIIATFLGVAIPDGYGPLIAFWSFIIGTWVADANPKVSS